MGKAWVKARRHDRFYRAAKKQAYRSRAAIKLSQIDRRIGLFQAGDVVVDLGAAPGGWSQIARERIGPSGRVLAVDLGSFVVKVFQGDGYPEFLRRVTAAFEAAKGMKPSASSPASAELYVVAVGRL